MLARTMPLVTFRDEQTGEQETVRLTKLVRRADKPDRYKPWPRRGGVRMTPVQIQYGAD